MERRSDDGDLPSPEKLDSSLWGMIFFSVAGATATTVAVVRLRKTFDRFYSQLSRSKTFSEWWNTSEALGRGTFREEAWKRHYRRMQEEHEDEMERLERIRRMQSVFNRQKNKSKKSYESWKADDGGTYNHIPRDDWYWKTDANYKTQKSNFRPPRKESVSYELSQHYSVLGLDRSRTKPYTDAEIKIAFRAKAMEYHPDQNQDNKEAAEEKFKEVMKSYEAIKLERNNGKR